MNLDRYKQLLAEYKPAAIGEKDYLKRAIARDDWSSITRNSKYSPEHTAAFTAYKEAQAQPHAERMRDKEEEAIKAMDAASRAMERAQLQQARGNDLI